MDKSELLEIINKAAVSKQETVSLAGKRLTQLPPQIVGLTKLQRLYLGHNRLTELPPQIAKLTNLQVLDLAENRLTELPPDISKLTNLRALYLFSNRLTALPPEIGKLTNLQVLVFSFNQLTELPPEVGRLTNLRALYLTNNRLTELPPQIAKLTNLRKLRLQGNRLKFPPPEIVEQGTEAILAYLREKLEGETPQWVSKLLLVGEGGVGKTSVLRALRGEDFDDKESTTHGIDVDSLEMPHPNQQDVTMRLSTWDFGGQEIYHATHQFFLTNRSLFLLVWDARHGWEAGRLHYWLDTIQAKAPESPVIIVAAHTDERLPSLPYEQLAARYPNVIGHCEVSNSTGEGIDALREIIAKAAADLPLMGETWPTAWLNAAEAIRAREERYVTVQQLCDLMAEHGVTDEGAGVLAAWLHELGDILFFQDDEELCDTVILDAEWVTKCVDAVLECPEVKDGLGVFKSDHMNTVWRDIKDPLMRQHFLRLMERFDLSYRTLENRDISIVVERLSEDPVDYEPEWSKNAGPNELSMRFRLNTLPAGIPTWFIARSHRFTTYTHWRHGALFADDREQRTHVALVESFPHERYVQLTARGPCPHNFFALLKDGLDLTLDRFPGLRVSRLVPCPGHNSEPCEHEFDLSHVEKAIGMNRPTIECPAALEQVSVAQLAYGVSWDLPGGVEAGIERLQKQHAAILEGQDALRELVQREFLKVHWREQKAIDSHCPNVFTLRPVDSPGWKKKLAGQKVELQLYCQAPGCWHPTEEGGKYAISLPADWLRAIAPYVGALVKVLKYAAPIAAPATGMRLPDLQAEFEHNFKLMEELVKKLPDVKDPTKRDLIERIPEEHRPEEAHGAALRAVRGLLDEKDPVQHWGGLRKVLTPEGHYLWLCDHHAQEYRL